MAVDTFFGSFISHTYERDDGYSTSWPDYFITNSDFVSSFKMIKCPKLGHSLSDHHPLFVNVTFKGFISDPGQKPCDSNKHFTERVNWDQV